MDKKMLVKQSPKVVGLNADVLTLDVPIGGLIDAKEGKETHVVTSGKFDLPRTDGKVVTIQLNCWYK